MTAVHDHHLDLELDTRDVSGSEVPSEDTPLRQALFPEEDTSFFVVKLAVRGGSDLTHLNERRFILFDLAHPQVETCHHSLVWLNHRWEDVRFIFVADAHVSTSWDQIEEDFLKLDPAEEDPDSARSRPLRRFFSRQAFADTFINPNRNFRAFIREANTRAARGELDFVILGGDLVEYQHPSQFEFFEKIVTGRADGGPELEVPLFTIPGNHDYRRHPYRIQAYPLDRCGLHDRQKDFFLKKARGESLRRFTIKDTKTVLADGGKGHPLADYLVHVNPETDFTLKIGRTKIVFLDTGRDVFRNLARIHPRRWKNYIQALFHNWLFPASSGLKDDQAEFLRRESSEEGFECLVLVFHAGLANPPLQGFHDQKASSRPEFGHDKTISPGEVRLPFTAGDILAAGTALGNRIRIEDELTRSGLNRGGLFQNQLFLLRAAAGHDRRVLGLSGHFHRSVELRFEKETGNLFAKSGKTDGFRADRAKDSSFFFASGPLGHLQFRFDPPGRPEYLLIEIADKTISSVERERLRTDPFDAFWIQARETGSSPTGISITPEFPISERENRAEDLTLNLSFLVLAKPVKSASGGFPYKIVPVPSAGVTAARPEWIPEHEQKEFFRRKRPVYLQSFRCNLNPEWTFLFYPKGYFRGSTEVIVLAELLSRGDGSRERSRLFWHPLSVRLRPTSGTDTGDAACRGTLTVKNNHPKEGEPRPGRS